MSMITPSLQCLRWGKRSRTSKYKGFRKDENLAALRGRKDFCVRYMAPLAYGLHDPKLAEVSSR